MKSLIRKHIRYRHYWGAMWLLVICTLLTLAFFARQTRQTRSPQTPTLLSMEYRLNPQPAYKVAAEVLAWTAEGELQPQRLDYEPRESGWWVVVDFGPLQTASLSGLAAGRFVQSGRLPTTQSPLLELRLASQDIRAVLDSKRPNALVLLEPGQYIEAWKRLGHEEAWGLGLELLEEIDRLDARQLGLSVRQIRQARLEFLRGQGREFMAAGAFRQAAQSLSQAHEIEPGFESDLLLAQAYLMDAKINQSRDLLEELRRRQPTRAEVFYFMGLGYLREKSYLEAIRFLEQATQAARINQSEPSLDPKVLCFLGTCYYEKSRFGQTSSQREDLQAAHSYLTRFLDHNEANEKDRQVASQTLQKVEEGLRQTALEAEDASETEPEEEDDGAADGADAPAMRSNIHRRLPFNHLEGLRGKVVLVHFWATWCGPCLRELPVLSEFFNSEFPALQEQGLELVTVSNDHRDKEFLDYAAGQNFKFLIFFDPLMEAQSHFGLGKDLPRTAVLGPDGKLMDVIQGEADWLSKEFQAQLASYLKANGQQ